MPIDLKSEIQQHFLNWSFEHSTRLSAVHSQLLSLRSVGLVQLANEIASTMGPVKTQSAGISTALYGNDWLEEFATGDIVNCLGEEYAIYSDRRCPRIPNGDLLLMSRILNIEGVRDDFQHTARISAEFEIPANAWFFEGAPNGELPISIMLEIALQPCGVLSAWLGTQLRFPTVDFFFRNLDGEAHYLRKFDLLGKTIRAHAELTKTVFSGSTIIQHFNFELLYGSIPFFKGSSSFGYFPDYSMASQVGIDSGSSSLPLGKESAIPNKVIKLLSGDLMSYQDIPAGKLRLIDEAHVFPDGGTHSNGYVMASRKNSPSDWFYRNHFFQDPVMPGSLGIEAITQAFKVGVHAMSGTDTPITLAEGCKFQWKYRGQVLQAHQEMQVEVHILGQQTINGKKEFTADASLWADDIRIYAIKNLKVQQD